MADENRAGNAISEEKLKAVALCGEDTTPVSSRHRSRPFAIWTLLLVFLGLAIALRLVALDSDAYPRLSWSSALVTDEGFYIHNARNRVLFGRERTDEFNNALIMPTLHYAQVGVFSLFGVGVIQARLISVVCSLLTLWLFWLALRRAFGVRCAWVGTLFLSLDHVFLLYNRLALMDTPAVLVLTAAFAAFVTGNEKARADAQTSLRWLAACGLLMIVAYATRGLFGALLPVPFLAFWCAWRRDRIRVRRALLALGAGAGVALMVYVLAWYLPHRAELTHVNSHYLRVQMLPKSVRRLRVNIQDGLVGVRRGMTFYLLRHSPVLFGATVAGTCFWLARRRRRTPLQENETGALCFLGFWFWTLYLLYLTITYMDVPGVPSRYFVLFYPAMAGLAAYFLTAEPGAFPWSRKMTQTATVGLLTAWALLNVYWLTDWLSHLTYRQREADRWLANHLPEGTVLFGAFAPGLCMNNRFRVVNMIEGLCNDRQPVEKFASAPRAVIILDNGGWTEKWWVEHYPDIIQPQNRIHRFVGVLRPFFTLGVYRVPEKFGQ